MDHTEYNLNTVDFNYFLAELRKGKIMNETSFYFVDEISEPEHYIGCLHSTINPTGLDCVIFLMERNF